MGNGDDSTATYSSGVLTTASSLDEINCRGTPFAAPSEFNQPPTAVTRHVATLLPGRPITTPILLAGFLLLVSRSSLTT